MATKYYSINLEKCRICGEKLNFIEKDNHIFKKTLLDKHILPSDELICKCGEPVIILVGKTFSEDHPFLLYIPYRWFTTKDEIYEDMPHTESQMLSYISSNTIVDQTGHIASYSYFKNLVEFYSKFKNPKDSKNPNISKNIGIKTYVMID